MSVSEKKIGAKSPARVSGNAIIDIERLSDGGTEGLSDLATEVLRDSGTEVHRKIQVKFWSSDFNCYFSKTKRGSEILKAIISTTKISNGQSNVLAVIGDQKLPVLQGGVVVSFEAHVISSQDYSPFGVTLSGKSWSAGYRYGFNGKERDDKTFDGAYDFGARILDTRLGRMFLVDPFVNLMAGLSSYCFADNSVLIYVDYY